MSRSGSRAARVDQLCTVLADLAPLALAESWDNVGLLVGDRDWPAKCVMTCLTVTPAVVEEAVRRRVDLLVAHHPLPFKPLARITADTPAGRMLLQLIAARVAVYSAHTAFDSAARGINQMWAVGLGLQSPAPLIPAADATAVADGAAEAAGAAKQSVVSSAPGGGRYGRLAEPCTLDELARRAAELSSSRSLRTVGGAAGSTIRTVGIACGSGGSFIARARMLGCDALVTGEATLHACLEAEALGVALVLVGHYASERFAMERLAESLQQALGRGRHDVEVFASRAEADPLRSL